MQYLTPVYKISMEIVGALPEPEEILPNTIISLFGILCKNVTESTAAVFNIGRRPQLQQLVAQQFAVHIAEQYFLANSYYFYV